MNYYIIDTNKCYYSAASLEKKTLTALINEKFMTVSHQKTVRCHSLVNV